MKKKTDEQKIKVVISLEECDYFKDLFDLCACIHNDKGNIKSEKNARAISDKFKKIVDKPGKKAMATGVTSVRFSNEDVRTMLHNFIVYNAYSHRENEDEQAAEDNIELTVEADAFDALVDDIESELCYLSNQTDEDPFYDEEENAAATARYKDLLETMNSGSNTETDDAVNMSMSRDKIEDLLNFAGNSISEWQDANADLSVECCARQDAIDELTKQVESFDEWLLNRYKRVCHASSLAFKAVKGFGDLFDAVAEIANIDDFDEIVKDVNSYSFSSEEE